MKFGFSFRERARVVMHLNGGFTKVLFEDTLGSGLGDGGLMRDIPTANIPLPLRAVGSRFMLSCQAMAPEVHDSTEDVRAEMHRVVVEALPDALMGETTTKSR